MKGRSLVSIGLLVAPLICSCTGSGSQSIGQRTQALADQSPSPSPLATSSAAKSKQASQVDRTWPSKFKFRRKSFQFHHDGNRGFQIAAACPQVVSGSPATRRFNRWILRRVRGYIAQFKGLERFAEIHDKKRHLRPANIEESLEIGYRVYYADKRLISMRLTHRVMAIGQMHPIDYYETLNYQLQAGRDLSAADVFRPAYLKAFAASARKELNTRYELKDEWSQRGTEPEERNFKNWNIVPDGILLSFEDYQIGPHSFGQAEFIIPFSAIKRVWRGRGVLRHVVKEK